MFSESAASWCDSRPTGSSGRRSRSSCPAGGMVPQGETAGCRSLREGLSSRAAAGARKSSVIACGISRYRRPWEEGGYSVGRRGGEFRTGCRITTELSRFGWLVAEAMVGNAGGGRPSLAAAGGSAPMTEGVGRGHSVLLSSFDGFPRVSDSLAVHQAGSERACGEATGKERREGEN